MSKCDWPGMSFLISPSSPQVLRNDVLSHHATVNTVNSAAAELLESSPGDEASHLRDQLDQLNQSWESLLLKTQERQKLLEAALQQVLHLISFVFPFSLSQKEYKCSLVSNKWGMIRLYPQIIKH